MSTIGRPLKKGLDYFAHSVKHTDEEKILFRKYGCNGYTVYYVLREKITENGYYYELSERKRLLLCTQFHLDEDIFLEILHFALELALFDKTVFETYGVLTSEALQIDYILATSRRKRIDFFEEYYLISESTLLSEIPDNKIHEKIAVYSIDANINDLYVNTNCFNDDSNSQSRVEYSKSKKESRVREKREKKQPAQARSVGKGYEKESAERENKGKPILDIIAMPKEEFEEKFLN